MPRNEPEMITGHAHADDYTHAPKAMTIEEELLQMREGGVLVEAHQAAPKLGDKSKGLRRFRSDSPKLRLQIRTSKPHQTADGYWIEGESEFVQFKPFSAGGGSYTTENIKEIETIEGCTAYGVTIFDIDAMEVESEKKRMTFVEDMVMKDQRLLERLKVKFGLKDFVDDDFGSNSENKSEPKGKRTKKGE